MGVNAGHICHGVTAGVDPADIAVRPAVNDHPAAGPVLEHDAGGPVRSSSMTASLTEPLQRRGRLGNDDRAIGGNLLVALGRRLDHIARRIEHRPADFRQRLGGIGLAGRAVLQPALVAAQALLDHQQRLVGAGIGIGGVGSRLGVIQIRCSAQSVRKPKPSLLSVMWPE